MTKISTPKWVNYTEWECFVNKMYEKRKQIEYIMKSYEVLTDDDLCRQCMERVTKEWTKSTMFNFTNKMFNPISWLGQAACCLNHGAKSTETIEAWLSMTYTEQSKANDIAKEVIAGWRSENL